MNAILYAPLIVVNIWHGLVIWLARRRSGIWRSISESAASGDVLLRTHRIVHGMGAACFYAYASWLWQWPHYRLAVFILMFAATCDMVQSLVLSKRTIHRSFTLSDVHQVTSWTMATGYFAFSLLFGYIVGISPVWLTTYVVWLVVVYGISYATRHRYFWLAQMVFFVSTAILIGLSGLEA
jgi:hypothetical protein